MKSIELTVLTSEEASEAVCDFMLRTGALGTATEDPYEIKRIIESGENSIFADPEFLKDLPDYVKIKAYFRDRGEEEKNRLISKIRNGIDEISEYLDCGETELTYKTIEDDDYMDNWKSYFHSFHISDKLVIRPSWEKYDSSEGETVIIMDAGRAFGTGEHETTGLCLKVLDRTDMKGKKFLDLGTGSGILAILAEKRGARPVFAVDTDPEAVKTAAENFSKNGIEDGIQLSCGRISELPEDNFDIIVANLLAEIHYEEAEQYAEKLAPGGVLLLSGIVRDKAEDLQLFMESKGFRLEERLGDGDWILLVFRH